MSHDYCHCHNDECPLRSSCFRYFLYLEDKNGRGPGWCTYAGHHPDEDGKCKDYIPLEEDEGK